MEAVKTKFIAIFMAVAMVFAMTPLIAGTAHATLEYAEITDGVINYVVVIDGSENAGTAYVQSCSSDATRAVIKSEVTYEGKTYPVTRIISRAQFYYSDQLEYVWIPASVTEIQYLAFEACKAEKIVFEPGSKLTKLADSAFYKCSNLKSIDIPSGVTSIPHACFAQCSSLKDIVIPDGVTDIGEYAFYESPSLQSAIIPASVTSIGRCAFDDVNAGFMVHYLGTEEQWNGIIANGWTNVDATVHFCPETTIVKATPEADGVIKYTCKHDDWTYWEYIVGTISRPAKFKLSKTSYTYNGSAKKPTVTVTDADGNKISGENYGVTYPKNTNAGTAIAKVTFKGAYYDGTKSLNFTINKASNPLSVKGKTANVKYSKLKNKTQTLKASAVYNLADKGQGTLTYVKKSGSKKITIAKKDGKVTVKKGLAKGTYKVKVKITAKGNSNYKSADKTITFKIKVK